jgi:hypothetical protein
VGDSAANMAPATNDTAPIAAPPPQVIGPPRTMVWLITVRRTWRRPALTKSRSMC